MNFPVILVIFVGFSFPWLTRIDLAYLFWLGALWIIIFSEEIKQHEKLYDFLRKFSWRKISEGKFEALVVHQFVIKWFEHAYVRFVALKK